MTGSVGTVPLPDRPEDKRLLIDAEAGRSVPRFTAIRKLANALEVEPASIAEFAAAMGLSSAPARATGGEDV